MGMELLSVGTHFVDHQFKCTVNDHKKKGLAFVADCKTDEEEKKTKKTKKRSDCS